MLTTMAFTIVPQNANAQFFKELLNAAKEVVSDSKSSSQSSKKEKTKKAVEEDTPIKYSGKILSMTSSVISYTMELPRINVTAAFQFNQKLRSDLHFIILVDNAPLPLVTDYDELMRYKKKGKSYLTGWICQGSSSPVSSNYYKMDDLNVPIDSKTLTGTSNDVYYLRGYVIRPETKTILDGNCVAECVRSKMWTVPGKGSGIYGKVFDVKVKDITIYDDGEAIMEVELKVWRRFYNSSYDILAALSFNPIQNAEAYQELPEILSPHCYGNKTMKGMPQKEIETVVVEVPIKKAVLPQLGEKPFYITGYVFHNTVISRFYYEMSANKLDYQYHSQPLSLAGVPTRKGNKAAREFFGNLTVALHDNLFNDVGGGTKCTRCKGTGTVTGAGGGAVDCPNCNGNGKIYDAFDAFASGSKAIQANKAKQSQQKLSRTGTSPKGVRTKVFESGDKYTGTFKYGLCHGKGTYIWKTGGKYVGDVFYGQMQGKGTLTFANGDKYVGEFWSDRPDGKGVMTYIDGSKYEGDFYKGQRSGKGTLYFANGNKYVGDFIVDGREGKGIFYWASGGSYEGDFRGNNFHGKGVEKFPNGDCYTGEYKYGKKEGKGKYVWADGTVYEGDWTGNERTGYGKITWPDNTYFQGRFVKGKPQK